MPVLSPGQIVTLYCDWLKKSKYFLVVGAEPELFIFYISSKLTPYALTKETLWPDHIKITKTQHTFLDHDSWLNCSIVCKKFNWKAIEYQLRTGDAKKCGLIHSDAKKQVLEVVEKSENLSAVEKKIILAALGPKKPV